MSYVIAATETPLAANGSYSTVWIRLAGIDALDSGLTLPPVEHNKLYLIGVCFSDQPSSASGFTIQQSLDGSTAFYSRSTTQAGNEYIRFKHLVIGKYVRINYTNAATPQTTFNLFARLVTDG